MFELTRSNAVRSAWVSLGILLCMAALVLSWTFVYPTVIVSGSVIIPLVLVWIITTLFLVGFTWCIHGYDYPPIPDYDSAPLDAFIDNRSHRPAIDTLDEVLT